MRPDEHPPAGEGRTPRERVRMARHPNVSPSWRPIGPETETSTDATMEANGWEFGVFELLPSAPEAEGAREALPVERLRQTITEPTDAERLDALIDAYEARGRTISRLESKLCAPPAPEAREGDGTPGNDRAIHDETIAEVARDLRLMNAPELQEAYAQWLAADGPVHGEMLGDVNAACYAVYRLIKLKTALRGAGASRERWRGRALAAGWEPRDGRLGVAPPASVPVEGDARAERREVQFRDVIDRLASLVGELAPRTRRVQDIAAVVHEGLALCEPREASIAEQVEAAARAMARANDDDCFEDYDQAVANRDLMSSESFDDEVGAGEEDRYHYRTLASAALLAIPSPAAPVETGDAERHPIDKETRRALFDAQAALMQAAIDMPAGPRRGRAQRASRRMSDFIAERRVLTDALAAAQARRAAVPSPVDGEREEGER